MVQWIECEWDENVFHICAADVVMTMDNDQGFHLRLRDNEDDEAGWYTVVGTTPDYSIEEQYDYRNMVKSALGMPCDAPPAPIDWDSIEAEVAN